MTSIATTPEVKYVQHLLCNRTYGIKGLTTQFWLSLPVVLSDRLEHLLNTLLTSQQLKEDEQTFASIQLFNAKIWLPKIKD